MYKFVQVVQLFCRALSAIVVNKARQAVSTALIPVKYGFEVVGAVSQLTVHRLTMGKYPITYERYFKNVVTPYYGVDITDNAKRSAHCQYNELYCQCLNIWLDHTAKFYQESDHDTMPAFTPITFVNSSMSEEQFDDFDTWFDAMVEILDEMVAQVVTENAKLSLSYNGERNAYYATVTTTSEHKKSPSYGTSSFAGNPIEALALTCYKYTVLAKTDLSTFKHRNTSLRG